MPLLIWGGSAFLSAIGLAGWGSSKAIHETKDIVKWIAIAAIVLMLIKNAKTIKGFIK